MEANSIVTFVNVTKEPFVGYWNKEAYPVAAGESRVMELWRALHFAKHLVDRILNERNIPTNTQAERDELVKQIIKGVEPVTAAPAPADDAEAVDVPEAAPMEAPKPGKRGRGKKDKEFEDLDNE